MLRLLIAVLCFFPLLKHLYVGQTTIFALGGLVLALKLFRKEQWFKSGLALSATFFKPHLFVPLYVFLIISGLRSRHRCLIDVAFGVIFSLLLLSLCCIALRPTLPLEFLASTSGLYKERLAIPQVTLGHAIAILTGFSVAVPILGCLGVVGGAGLGIVGSKMNYLEKATHALFLGVLCAPYGWAHDHVTLLIPYLVCAETLLNKTFLIGVLVLIAQFLYSAWLFSTDAWNLEWGIIAIPLVLWPLYFAISKRIKSVI